MKSLSLTVRTAALVAALAISAATVFASSPLSPAPKPPLGNFAFSPLSPAPKPPLGNFAFSPLSPAPKPPLGNAV